MDRIENKTKPPHSDISEIVIGCCFEVIKELGAGFEKDRVTRVHRYLNTCLALMITNTPRPRASTFPS